MESFAKYDTRCGMAIIDLIIYVSVIPFLLHDKHAPRGRGRHILNPDDHFLFLLHPTAIYVGVHTIQLYVT